jgi:hypothetical protein
MIAVVVAFALLMLGIGLFGAAVPARLIAFARFWQNPAALWLAAGIRVVFGLALYLVAPDTRAPGAFQTFGILVVLAGVALPFLGRERIGRLIDWWAALPEAVIRGWALLAVLFGVLILYGLGG